MRSSMHVGAVDHQMDMWRGATTIEGTHDLERHPDRVTNLQAPKQNPRRHPTASSSWSATRVTVAEIKPRVMMPTPKKRTQSPKMSCGPNLLPDRPYSTTWPDELNHMTSAWSGGRKKKETEWAAERAHGEDGD